MAKQPDLKSCLFQLKKSYKGFEIYRASDQRVYFVDPAYAVNVVAPRRMAFISASHARLGEKSPAHVLPTELLCYISCMAWGPARPDAHRLLSCTPRIQTLCMHRDWDDCVCGPERELLRQQLPTYRGLRSYCKLSAELVAHPLSEAMKDATSDNLGDCCTDMFVDVPARRYDPHYIHTGMETLVIGSIAAADQVIEPLCWIIRASIMCQEWWNSVHQRRSNVERPLVMSNCLATLNHLFGVATPVHILYSVIGMNAKEERIAEAMAYQKVERAEKNHDDATNEFSILQHRMNLYLEVRRWLEEHECPYRDWLLPHARSGIAFDLSRMATIAMEAKAKVDRAWRKFGDVVIGGKQRHDELKRLVDAAIAECTPLPLKRRKCNVSDK